MNTAFVLGNGISRSPVDLDRLHLHGHIYGCNALYREFTPDVLVSTDRLIARHIQETGYSSKNRFHTRKPIPNLGARAVPSQYYGNSSGPIAIALAAQDAHKHIYILGFDMGPDQNNQFNNVYAGTEFYKEVGTAPTFTGNWVKQLVKVVHDFPQIKFYRVHGETTHEVAEFNGISNFDRISLPDFQQHFNC